MHELSLCRAIADTVRAHAGGRPVSSVSVQVGWFRQVVPSTLELCWELTTEGTDLAGCVLAVDHVPAVTACRDCGAERELERPVLVCPACGSRAVDLRSGEELVVSSIDVLERT